MASRGTRSTTGTARDTPGESSNTQENQLNPELAKTTLADKYEAARRRIAELEEEIRMRNELEEMEAQIRWLESTNASADPVREPVVPQAVPLVRRAPKTRELPTYKGKNIKEAQDFFYQAELKWREDGDITWDTDAAKVTHGVSCFEGIPRDVWKRRERSIGVDNTS